MGKMKNKKAMELLGEHTVNLIIAVLSIVVLIMLGTAIYNLFLGEKTDLAKAKATLNDILIPNLNSLQNEGDSQIVLIYNPVDWGIIFQDSLEKRPAVCKGHKCLCICKYDSDVEDLFDNCNDPKLGTCLVDDRDIIVERRVTFSSEADVIQITGIINLNLSLSKGTIRIRRIS
ncbi:MAG: hypothetical protein Q8L27_00765 [archaeon]|nr:hypothetical protein [archaeon]